VLDPHSLEAEATGLLDRMLGVLQDNSRDAEYQAIARDPSLTDEMLRDLSGHALTIDATLNTLSILIRGRPSTSNRILNALLNFNPLKLASSSMSMKTRFIVKSIEKTTRVLLAHIARRYLAHFKTCCHSKLTIYRSDPRNPLNGKIQGYLERLMQLRAEVFDSASRKRALAERGDDLDAKRQRMAATQPEFQIPPLKSGPHSLADVFTLTRNEGLRTFDVSLIPAALAAKVSINTIARINPNLLSRAINVSSRPMRLHSVYNNWYSGHSRSSCDAT
jgi:symplekin